MPSQVKVVADEESKKDDQTASAAAGKTEDTSQINGVASGMVAAGVAAATNINFAGEAGAAKDTDDVIDSSEPIDVDADGKAEEVGGKDLMTAAATKGGDTVPSPLEDVVQVLNEKGGATSAAKQPPASKSKELAEADDAYASSDNCININILKGDDGSAAEGAKEDDTTPHSVGQQGGEQQQMPVVQRTSGQSSSRSYAQQHSQQQQHRIAQSQAVANARSLQQQQQPPAGPVSPTAQPMTEAQKKEAEEKAKRDQKNELYDKRRAERKKKKESEEAAKAASANRGKDHDAEKFVGAEDEQNKGKGAYGAATRKSVGKNGNDMEIIVVDNDDADKKQPASADSTKISKEGGLGGKYMEQARKMHQKMLLNGHSHSAEEPHQNAVEIEMVARELARRGIQCRSFQQDVAGMVGMAPGLLANERYSAMASYLREMQGQLADQRMQSSMQREELVRESLMKDLQDELARREAREALVREALVRDLKDELSRRQAESEAQSNDRGNNKRDADGSRKKEYDAPAKKKGLVLCSVEHCINIVVRPGGLCDGCTTRSERRSSEQGIKRLAEYEPLLPPIQSQSKRRKKRASPGRQAPHTAHDDNNDRVGPSESPGMPAFFFFILHNRAAIEKSVMRKSPSFRGMAAGTAKNEKLAQEGAAMWSVMSLKERNDWAAASMKGSAPNSTSSRAKTNQTSKAKSRPKLPSKRALPTKKSGKPGSSSKTQKAQGNKIKGFSRSLLPSVTRRTHLHKPCSREGCVNIAVAGGVCMSHGGYTIELASMAERKTLSSEEGLVNAPTLSNGAKEEPADKADEANSSRDNAVNINTGGLSKEDDAPTRAAEDKPAVANGEDGDVPRKKRAQDEECDFVDQKEGAAEEAIEDAPHAAADKPDTADDGDTWTCDVCHKATFEDYDKAIAHEKTCAGTNNDAPADTSADPSFISPTKDCGSDKRIASEAPDAPSDSSSDAIAERSIDDGRGDDDAAISEEINRNAESICSGPALGGDAQMAISHGKIDQTICNRPSCSEWALESGLCRVHERFRQINGTICSRALCSERAMKGGVLCKAHMQLLRMKGRSFSGDE